MGELALIIGEELPELDDHWSPEPIALAIYDLMLRDASKKPLYKRVEALARAYMEQHFSHLSEEQ